MSCFTITCGFFPFQKGGPLNPGVIFKGILVNLTMGEEGVKNWEKVPYVIYGRPIL